MILARKSQHNMTYRVAATYWAIATATNTSVRVTVVTAAAAVLLHQAQPTSLIANLVWLPVSRHLLLGRFGVHPRLRSMGCQWTLCTVAL